MEALTAFQVPLWKQTQKMLEGLCREVMGQSSVIAKKKYMRWIFRFSSCLCVYARTSFKLWICLSFRVKVVFSLICLNIVIVWLEAVAFWGLLVSFNPEHPSVSEPISKRYLSGERKWCVQTYDSTGGVFLPIYTYFKKSMRRNWKFEKGRLAKQFSTLFCASFSKHHV